MIRSLLFSALALATPCTAEGWETFIEKEDDGRGFSVAEQVGEGGYFLRLVCFEDDFHIELVIPERVEEADTALVFQVDHKPERLIAGFFERMDNQTTVFVGVDRRDDPAKATPIVLDQIKAGRELYLGDPDLSEAYERWDLKGATKAIRTAKGDC
jgi:hypothetical protein